MATEDYWSEFSLDREEPFFSKFCPTLDSMIGEDDVVRLFDEVLSEIDWSSWEFHYKRRRGQPPIHPRQVAAAILYGMFRGIRSSRRLEEACQYRLDFIWLVRRRRIDHTTFNKFRTRFREPLKDLFKQIGRIGIELGLIGLGRVGFDGSRVKANNSRFQTRTAKTLEEKLQALGELFEHLMSELNAADAEEAGTGSPTHLPEELADIQERRQQVQAALAQARAADEARRQQGVNPSKNPAQVPITDPDSRVMPNKEGGYAPNYTPVVTTDSVAGFIVDCDVLSEVQEGKAAIEAVDRIEETFGQRPEQMLSDAGNNNGHILHEMEQRNVEYYVPVPSSQPQPGNPALREDHARCVPESQWTDLPRNNQGQLDKSCFVYVPEEDQYYCPQGHAMPLETTQSHECGGVRIQRRMYRCSLCAGCPLASACVSTRNKRGRTVTRDEYDEVRERTAARMASEAGRQIYKQRAPIAETAFGILKMVMGFRQFLLRGLEKVKTEWLWAVTAFNAMKLARAIGKLRAEIAEMPATTAL